MVSVSGYPAVPLLSSGAAVAVRLGKLGMDLAHRFDIFSNIVFAVQLPLEFLCFYLEYKVSFTSFFYLHRKSQNALTTLSSIPTFRLFSVFFVICLSLLLLYFIADPLIKTAKDFFK